MSSLIFYTDEKQALIATDTLVVSEEDKEPLCFASKAIYLPHLRTIVASTGVSRFCEQWICAVNQMVVSDIEELNHYSPVNLIKLFRWFSGASEFENPPTVTIYHIGFSETDGRIHSFAYRSTGNFRSESLIYGIAIEPPCSFPAGDFTFTRDVPGLMNRQRDEQNGVPFEKRVPIGGEIHGMCLTAEGCNAFKLGTFDDYFMDKQKVEARSFHQM